MRGAAAIRTIGGARPSVGRGAPIDKRTQLARREARPGLVARHRLGGNDGHAVPRRGGGGQVDADVDVGQGGGAEGVRAFDPGQRRAAMRPQRLAVGQQQVEATVRGDGRQPVAWVSAAAQKAALDALMETLKPSELALSRAVLSKIPPRPDGSSQVSMQLRELMVDIEAGRMPRKAVAILYRQEVLGESLAELGAEAGISPDAIRKQRDRSVAAIRRLLEAA